MTSEPNSLSPIQQQAYRCIELFAQWEGGCNATHLMQTFNISRPTARDHFKDYMAQHPDNLCYDDKTKSYQPTAHFEPKHSSGQLDDYISISQRGLNTDLQAQSGNTLRLGSHQRQPRPEIVRHILKAIDKNLRLDIQYASLNQPTGEDRIISPHSLIHDGHRWHTRAWCEKSQDYRDFVLTRILNIYDHEGKAQRSAEHDERWNTWLSLSIEPDPRLDPNQQQLIAMDYGMEKNAAGKYQKHYEIRAALLIYWKQQLRIDRYRDSAEAQQIILSPSCAETLKKWTI